MPSGNARADHAGALVRCANDAGDGRDIHADRRSLRVANAHDAAVIARIAIHGWCRTRNAVHAWELARATNHTDAIRREALDAGTFRRKARDALAKGRHTEDATTLLRRAENAGPDVIRNREGQVRNLPRLAVDADIVDGRACHTGHIHPCAQHAGKIRILINFRSSFGLRAANLPPMATVGSNTVKPAAELAADLEA